MIGAIVGDIAGSRFEFHNRKSKTFTFLVRPGEGKKQGEFCFFTDDTVMTLAVAQALSDWRESGSADYGELSALTVRAMQAFGRRYPGAGYGGHFAYWIGETSPQPYNSWGNGAAMRVSACGWAGRTLDEVKALSRAVTEVTHNHSEGIKGAEATAVCVFLARQGKSKDEIKTYVREHYYPLDFTLDEIRPGYSFDVSCQGSVPQALEAFFESTSFEDAIRNAISIGGDSDTIGAICGAVAEAFYGVPKEIRSKALTFLPQQLVDVIGRFNDVFCQQGVRKIKELVERTISDEVANLLVPESVKVIGFAEVGAQGSPEYVIVLSDEGSRICRDEGHFSFMHNGERHGGGVCMENLYKVAPFLKDFLGNSIESTKRGHFKFGNDGEWIHLDARFGNHFFIRSNMIKEFIERFDKIPDGYIAQDGIDVAIDMLRGEK